MPPVPPPPTDAKPAESETQAENKPAASLAMPPVGPPRPQHRPSRRIAPATAPTPEDERGTRTIEDVDREIDQAMGRDSTRKLPDINLKKAWDDEIEAELAAAMQGFESASYETRSQPRRAHTADRAHVDKANLGQEEPARPGTIKARVVAIRGNNIFVDVGGKSEGVLPISQLKDQTPEIGAILEVVRERFDPKEGLLRVSLPNAAVEATWENLKKGVIIEVRGTKVTKGGLEVDAHGIRGFMPISQIDLNRVEDAAPYVNQKLKVLVTEANPRERNLVVSRRDFLEKERAELRQKTWAELAEGQVRSGVVRNLKPFGAFIDLGGVDGLIPIGEMAWGRIKDPSEVLSLGQEVEVQVLRIDRDLNKVTLGLKQLKASPWDDLEDRIAPGRTVKGKVTRIMEFGAFVELEPGIEGLIHISELANKRVFRVKDFVQEGQEVEVRVLKIDYDTQRIALSLKPEPQAPKTDVPAEDEPEDAAAAAVAAPRPERKIPLKGGLGDRDPNPFGKPPR
jgi:small subunit ribosomal protein S1